MFCPDLTFYNKEDANYCSLKLQESDISHSMVYKLQIFVATKHDYFKKNIVVSITLDFP